MYISYNNDVYNCIIKGKILNRIVDYMDNYDRYKIKMQRQKQSLLGDFFHGKNLYQRIKESKLEV